MVPYIQSNNVIEEQSITYLYPTTPQGLVRQIPVVGTVIVAAYWKIPVLQSNGLLAYKNEPAINSTPPTPDSVKMLLLKNNEQNQTWGIAIANTDQVTTSAWNTAASAAAGTTQTMPAVTVPTPIIQFGPVSTDGSGTNVFLFEFPNNPLGLRYGITAPWFNGIAPTTAYAPTGIGTVAAIVTWANTTGHWDAYGTWSSPSPNILKLSSPTSATTPVKMAGMNPTLTAKPQCLDCTSTSTPIPVNGVKFGSGGPIITFPAFMLTNTAASLQALVNSIQPLIPAATFAIQAGNNKITITTNQDLVRIMNGSTTQLTAAAVAYGSVCP